MVLCRGNVLSNVVLTCVTVNSATLVCLLSDSKLAVFVSGYRYLCGGAADGR